MMRPFLGPRSSRFEDMKRFQHVQLTLALLGSIGSIRYSLRPVLGARVTEYLLGDANGREWVSASDYSK
eukprot:14517676-Alexandrium_andersonii.AAC.1